MDKQELRGMSAIITGGSTELAEAVALSLAREGVQVCLCGPRADLLELASKKIEAAGKTCMAVAVELDSQEAAETVVEQVRKTFHRLDLLILVSPCWAGGEIYNHSIKAWDMVINANLREPFLMARAVLPFFREQKHGEIMAIGSDSALGIYQQDGVYGVAMHALKALMELIRVENAGFGIRTHILSPGVTLTLDTDSEGKPSLMPSHVADWVIWLLTRPPHLRGNGSILI